MTQSAQAETPSPTTYNFQVLITVQDNEGECPAAGTLMPLSITVDRAFPLTPRTNDTEHYHGGPAFNTPSPILAVLVNNHASYEPNMDDIYITRGYNGNYGREFSGFDDSIGIDIKFASPDSAQVPSYLLPPTIYPKRSTTATFTYTGKESYCTGNVVSR